MADQEVPLGDRIASAVMLAYGQQGYVDEEGAVDYVPLVQAEIELVLPAVAAATKDRADVCITRRAIMERIFPNVVGPEGWAEEEDPDLAAGVYKLLDSTCWRMTSMAPSGPIQSRLNSDHALVLCRTKVNPHGTDAVYVTRDRGCILEDALKPLTVAMAKRANRDAALTAMLIERVPEYGKKFNEVVLAGMRKALGSTKAELEEALLRHDDDDGEQE